MHEASMHVECSRGLGAPLYAMYCANVNIYIYIQVYIVAGGYRTSPSSDLASTETLEKEGGSAWQLVASLPSARRGVRGLGLDRGRFMVTGEGWTILYNIVQFNSPLA